MLLCVVNQMLRFQVLHVYLKSPTVTHTHAHTPPHACTGKCILHCILRTIAYVAFVSSIYTVARIEFIWWYVKWFFHDTNNVFCSSIHLVDFVDPIYESMNKKGSFVKDRLTTKVTSTLINKFSHGHGNEKLGLLSSYQAVVWGSIPNDLQRSHQGQE